MSLPIVDPRVSVSAYSEDPTQKKLQLDELRKRIQGGENKEKQLHEACEGFEAVFVQKIWEQMRQTMPKGGYMHSKDEEMYQSMFDVELSKKMASAGGIGLADMLYEQLNAKLGQASRATSTSMLKNKQEIKELGGEPIALEPKYGNLKVDPAPNKLNANAGTDISTPGTSIPGAQAGLYEELNQGAQDLTTETVEMQATAAAELNTMQPKPESGMAGATPGPAATWQSTLQNLSLAYMNNMGRTDDPSRVGTFSAVQKQNPGIANNNQGLAASPAPAAGALPSNPLLVGNSAEPQVLSNNIRGFEGMKRPFAQPYSGFNTAANSQFESVETITPHRRTPQGASQGLNQETTQNASILQGAEADAPITPLTPPAANPPAQAFGQEISKNENAVPGGMFLQFDSVPDI